VLEDHALRLAGGVLDLFEGEAAAYEVGSSVSLHTVDHVIEAELEGPRAHMREVIRPFLLAEGEKIPEVVNQDVAFSRPETGEQC